MTYVIAILFCLAVIVLIAYSSPVRRVPFQQLYAKVPEEQRKSLQAFRSNNPLQSSTVDHKKWTYLSVGTGSQTILFLHGMVGAYDIWWQVIEALKDRFKIIAVTYPPVNNLEGLRRGILDILEKEKVSKCHVMGGAALSQAKRDDIHLSGFGQL